VGVGTVMDAKEVLFVITGNHKAFALYKCVEEGISNMWTVSAIQMHPKAIIACDEGKYPPNPNDSLLILFSTEATSELRVKTVKYFKGLDEQRQLTDRA
jgi:glucosamine-6-phosphate deaminase